MNILNATDVRNEWSSVVDSVIREKPKFIKRTRDYMMLSDISIIERFLDAYTFTAKKHIEDDGSITLELLEIDLVENGKTEQEAKIQLAKGIIEYSELFYEDFSSWSLVPNRRSHIPYVFKSLIINDAKKLGDIIQCQAGEI